MKLAAVWASDPYDKCPVPDAPPEGVLQIVSPEAQSESCLFAGTLPTERPLNGSPNTTVAATLLADKPCCSTVLWTTQAPCEYPESTSLVFGQRARIVSARAFMFGPPSAPQFALPAALAG